jgi:2-polyprenyl-6-methoxyphenol hydroxylase-like FAD-dependent oxidoreductase
MTSQEWKAQLMALFSDDRTPAAKIIAGASEIAPPWPTYDIPTVEHWASERSVLVGDAAHATAPSSGQGASMAIEDAIVLAKCLRDYPVREAFAQYESQRRQRVERVVAYGARTSSGKAAGAFGRMLRDLFMPVMLKRFGSMSTLRWMYDYRINWDPV